MSYVKVMIHAVWGTKNHHPFLTKEIRENVISHIKENAYKQQIFINSINGHTEHLHCLFGLNADITIAKTLQLIKGESAYWINKQNIIKSKFEWADEYYAVSISESGLDNVKKYIDNQEDHHKKLTYTQEYKAFIKKYNNKIQG